MRIDLAGARNVQQAFFPPESLSIPCMTCQTFYQPAHEIGGDYYDFFSLLDGRWGIAIGDVSGKGISAALIMASLQASVKAQALQPHLHLSTLIGSVNRLVHESSPTDLPPGKYRFHVVACNNDGVWNDVVAVAAFNVEPTFYQTFWFKALMAIAVLGVLWALYLLRLKQATANVHERLFAQIEERERIARELHDTLLQGFHGITLRMQGVTKNMPVRDPLRKMMEEVLDRGDEVLREARQRVRNLRRRTTDENELPDRLTKCGQELSKDHAATFTLAIVGEPKILESTVQDEAYRIAAEALTNAFRHASASKIEAEVTFDSSSLRIRVRDNGVGIDEAVRSNGHPGHWGLAGMRERAEAIRAQFNIWSRESAGTEVELVIQAAIAYPRDQRKPIESHPFRF